MLPCGCAAQAAYSSRSLFDEAVGDLAYLLFKESVQLPISSSREACSYEVLAIIISYQSMQSDKHQPSQLVHKLPITGRAAASSSAS